MDIKYIENKNESTYIEYADIMENNTVPVIKYKIFDRFKDEMLHGFSTREGGVSTEHLASLNLSYSRGDKKENVDENHRRFAKAVGYDCSRLVFSDQVHDTEILVVGEKDCGKGITKKSDIIGIDGLLTKEKNVPIMTFYADCVPLFFYDPAKKVIGMAHSGWKGTVKQIGFQMIRRMEQEFGSDPSDIITAIGPSICQGCYEVSTDVALRFMEVYRKEEIDELLLDKGNGKYLLNLHRACYFNFINAGIKPCNIAMPDICTCCNSKFMFSHRASKGMRGNLAGVMMLV